MCRRSEAQLGVSSEESIEKGDLAVADVLVLGNDNRIVQNPSDKAGHVCSLEEWREAREHLARHAACRPPVDRLGVEWAHYDLGRHKLRLLERERVDRTRSAGTELCPWHVVAALAARALCR